MPDLATIEPPEVDTLDRQDKLILNLTKGMSVSEAMIDAGYSPTVANGGGRYQIFNSPGMVAKIEALGAVTQRAMRGLHQTIITPKIIDVHDKAMRLYQDNPQMAIDKPKLMESAAKIAGLQAPDAGTTTTHNTQVNVLVDSLHAMFTSPDTDEPINIK